LVPKLPPPTQDLLAQPTNHLTENERPKIHNNLKQSICSWVLTLNFISSSCLVIWNYQRQCVHDADVKCLKKYFYTQFTLSVYRVLQQNGKTKQKLTRSGTSWKMVMLTGPTYSNTDSSCSLLISHISRLLGIGTMDKQLNNINYKLKYIRCEKRKKKQNMKVNRS
jgi:hypothetical protein